MAYRYDVFISYSTDPDYRLVKALQSFIEGFHSIVRPGEAVLRPLRVFVDESDLIQPGVQGAAADNAIRNLLELRLSETQLLLVLCSRNARNSRWVNEEIAWFLHHRGPDQISVAFTEPVSSEEIELIFPAALIEARLHQQVYYDFRGHHNPGTPAQWKVRSFEEQKLALVANLYRTSSSALAPLWQREVEARRRQVENALAGALDGHGRSALESHDIQRAATYFASSLEHREQWEVRSVLLRSLQELWRYDCVGGQRLETATAVISWSADGALIAGGSSTRLHIWDRHQNRQLALLESDSAFRGSGASFSPTGRRLLWWGEGSTALRFWDADEPGKQIAVSEGLQEAVAAWSPTGDQIAAWSPGKLHIFDARLTEVNQVEGLPLGFRESPCWSPSGKKIACFANNELRIWKSSAVQPDRVHHGIQAFAWAPDDTLLITESMRIVIVSGTKETVIPAPSGFSLIEARLSPSGRFMSATLSQSALGFLSIDSQNWTVFTRSQTFRCTWAPGIDRAVAWTNSGLLRLFQVDKTGSIVSHELESWESDADFGRAYAVWSPNSAYVATATRGGKLAVWDGESGERTTTLDADFLPGIPVAWSPDGRALAAGSRHNELQVWQRVSDWQPRHLPPETTDFAWSPTDELYVRLQESQGAHALVLSDGETETVIEKLPLDKPRPALAWPKEDELLLWQFNRIFGVSVQSGCLRLAWSAPCSSERKDILDPATDALPVRCLKQGENGTFWLVESSVGAQREAEIIRVGDELSLEGRFVCLREHPDTIRVVRADGREIGRVTEPGMAGGGISWAPESSYLIILADSWINIVGVDSDHITPLWRFSAADVITRHVWAPSGNHLALGIEDGTIAVLDLQRGTAVNLTPRLRSVGEIVWTADGARIIAATNHHQVYVFDVKSGSLLLKFPTTGAEEEGYVISLFKSVLGVSPQRGIVAIKDWEQRSALWDLNAALEPAAAISQRVGNLTGITIVVGEAVDARGLFERGLQKLLGGELSEGWATCSQALSLAPHGRRYVALCGVAKAALEGIEAGRPLLAQAWETDRSDYTYLWLRAVGIEEPMPRQSEFLTAMVDYLEDRIDSRELRRLARDLGEKAMATVAIARRLDLRKDHRQSRLGYLSSLRMRINRIDELWVKLRLHQMNRDSSGPMTTWLPITK